MLETELKKKDKDIEILAYKVQQMQNAQGVGISIYG